ncbi:MAG: ABC transporter substrate-binding protein [Bacteroidota bacterium]|nr:ABC transporter substrate-binding protein [Bacteroidota bacterium]
MFKKIRIGGVPEHFNFPWIYGINNKIFESYGIEVDWKNYPGGTGAMANSLKNNELDMAILLTEGAINFKLQNFPISIHQYYVKSPLIWGIHVNQNSKIDTIDQVFDKKYAISRRGSGSHLMAKLHAFEYGKEINEDQFVIVNDIQGAITSLTESRSDIFFWEKFTTKPYVDAKVLRRIGTFPTPWPCFVMVFRSEFYKANLVLIDRLLQIIENIVLTIRQLPNLSHIIANEYKLQVNDVETWLQSVEWASNSVIDNLELTRIANILKSANVVPDFVKDYNFKS